MLKYRQSIEDQRRITLAAIREKQYGEEEKMSRLHEAQRDCQERLQSKDGGTSLQLSCLNALSHETFSRKKILQELQREALEAKEELIEASKSRRIVEKLRDRDFERHRQNILHAERKHLDEIATGRFIRMEAQPHWEGR
ncbi:flagellar export protein FliJ [Candidatus Poribacteria bacterium]